MRTQNLILQSVLKEIVALKGNGTRIEYNESPTRMSLIFYNKEDTPIVRRFCSIIDKTEEEMYYLQYQLYLSAITDLATRGLFVLEEELQSLLKNRNA